MKPSEDDDVVAGVEAVESLRGEGIASVVCVQRGEQFAAIRQLLAGEALREPEVGGFLTGNVRFVSSRGQMILL